MIKKSKKRKTVGCIVARTVSSRLPLKVLRDVVPGLAMIDLIVQRAKLSENLDKVYLCTSQEPVDDILEDVALRNGVNLYRGSSNSVIERLLSVADKENADTLVRITGDNVFTSFEYLDDLIETHHKNDLDYTRIGFLPLGATPEVINLESLRDCNLRMDPEVSEYLMLYMFNPKTYHCGVAKIESLPDLSSYTLTVDTPNDLIRTRMILSRINMAPVDVTLEHIAAELPVIDQSLVRINDSVLIKLPYEKMISFSEFKIKMNKKISDSLSINIK